MWIRLGPVRKKSFSHSSSPRTLPSTVREASARKGVASANIILFGANKVLAPEILSVFYCISAKCQLNVPFSVLSVF